MPTVIGSSRKFQKKYKFVVEIDNFNSSQWQKCSELSAEIAKIEQWEGGSLIPNKSPGRVTFTDVTLDRGATDDEDLFGWYKQVANIAANSGAVDDDYKRNSDVVQQDRDGKTLRRWFLSAGWPTKFVAGDWDNTADENVMESTTMTYDYFDRIT